MDFGQKKTPPGSRSSQSAYPRRGLYVQKSVPQAESLRPTSDRTGPLQAMVACSPRVIAFFAVISASIDSPGCGYPAEQKKQNLSAAVFQYVTADQNVTQQLSGNEEVCMWEYASRSSLKTEQAWGGCPRRPSHSFDKLQYVAEEPAVSLLVARGTLSVPGLYEDVNLNVEQAFTSLMAACDMMPLKLDRMWGYCQEVCTIMGNPCTRYVRNIKRCVRHFDPAQYIADGDCLYGCLLFARIGRIPSQEAVNALRRTMAAWWLQDKKTLASAARLEEMSPACYLQAFVYRGCGGYPELELYAKHMDIPFVVINGANQVTKWQGMCTLKSGFSKGKSSRPSESQTGEQTRIKKEQHVDFKHGYAKHAMDESRWSEASDREEAAAEKTSKCKLTPNPKWCSDQARSSRRVTRSKEEATSGHKARQIEVAVGSSQRRDDVQARGSDGVGQPTTAAESRSMGGRHQRSAMISANVKLDGAQGANKG